MQSSTSCLNAHELQKILELGKRFKICGEIRLLDAVVIMQACGSELIFMFPCSAFQRKMCSSIPPSVSFGTGPLL